MKLKGTKPIVLIVDDEKSNTFLLSRILGKLDCEIMTASHGWEALDYMKEQVFALVVLDILMPGLNGYETLVRIKASELNNETPVFLMTEMETDQALLIKAYNAGAVDFIPKPVNLKVLQRKTKYFLEFFNQKVELQMARNQAENLMKQRMSMMANITHELRTPLFAMVGMIESLKEQSTNAQQKYLIERMESNSENLLDTVNEFLDFSKLEQSEQILENEYFSLSKLTEDLMSVMKFQYQKNKKVKLELVIGKEVADFIKADKKKIRHILMNLFSNAIKFTQKGCVKLDIQCIEEEKGSPIVTFRVIDTGVGLPADKLKTIFEEYAQVDNKLQGMTNATGLGLSIVNRYVNLLGGEVEVSSELGRGSVFSFSIPVETASESDLQDLNDPHHFEELMGSRELSILIVDDVPDNLFVLKNYLNINNIHLYLAHSSDQALDYMRENIFDIVFLDITMPDKDGFEVASLYQEICKKNQWAIGQMIMLSAYSFNSDIEAKMEANGVSHYLMKPIKKSLLFEKIITISHGFEERVNVSVIHEVPLVKEYDFSFLDEDFKDYIPRYLELKIAELAEMALAHKNNDNSTILAVCHKILGTAESFGLHKVATDIETVQLLVKEDYVNNNDKISRILEDCYNHLVGIESDLPQILKAVEPKVV